MATFQVEVVSAERQVLSVEAEAVYARSLEGEIGILPAHQPCLLALDTAPLTVVAADRTHTLAVHNGFLYYRGDTLVVLADTAEHADDIDPERARNRRDQLERHEDQDNARVRAAIKRQAVRLDVVG